MTTNPAQKSELIFLGVCKKLEIYTKIPAFVFRIIFLLLFFYCGIGLLAYLLTALFLKSPDSYEDSYDEIVKENFSFAVNRIAFLFKTGWNTFVDVLTRKNQNFYQTIGVIIITVGVIFVLWSLGLLKFVNFLMIIGLILIIIGYLFFRYR